MRRVALKSDEALFFPHVEPRWRVLDAVLLALGGGALWSLLLDGHVRSSAGEIVVIVTAFAGWSVALLRDANGFRYVAEEAGQLSVTDEHGTVLVASPLGTLRFGLDDHDRMVCSVGRQRATIGMRGARWTVSRASASIRRWEPDPERDASVLRGEWFRAATSVPLLHLHVLSWLVLAMVAGCGWVAAMVGLLPPWPFAIVLALLSAFMVILLPTWAVGVGLIITQVDDALSGAIAQWSAVVADARPGVWMGGDAREQYNRRALLTIGLLLFGLASGWSALGLLQGADVLAAWLVLCFSMLALRQLGFEAARQLRMMLLAVSRISMDGDRMCAERPYAFDVEWYPLAGVRLEVEGRTRTVRLDGDRRVVGCLLSPEADWSALEQALERANPGAFR